MCVCGGGGGGGVFCWAKRLQLKLFMLICRHTCGHDVCDLLVYLMEINDAFLAGLTQNLIKTRKVQRNAYFFIS